MTNSSTILLALAPVLIWRIVVRFRRQVGRQRSSDVRHKIHICLYSGLILLVAAIAWPQVETTGFLLLGAIAGCLLAQYGLRVTLFEPTKQGLFYTPKAWLGITLSLLFVGRIAYRIAHFLLVDPTARVPPPALMQSPATLAIFGVLAAYNMAYAIGLLLWRRKIISRARDAGMRRDSSPY